MGRDYEKEARNFVEVYADVVFSEMTKFSKASKSPLYEDFYESVYKGVSEKTGLTYVDVVSLSHPFHWVLFTGENDSPLRVVSKPESVSCVAIRSILEPSELVEKIMEMKSPMKKEDASDKKRMANNNTLLIVEKWKARFDGASTYHQ